MADLLCDLHHLADHHGIPFETIVERAACHHTDEVLEAEEGEP